MLQNSLRSLCYAILVLVVPYGPVLTAQQPPAVPPAPIPAQILVAKRVFVSNGENTVATGIPNLTYDEFYADLKSWGKYELVSAPADADVVFEIRFVAFVGGVNVMSGTGGSSTDQQLRLLILDPKTHVTLWQFLEHVKQAAREATARKNYDDAMNALVEDAKKLVSQPEAAAK